MTGAQTETNQGLAAVRPKGGRLKVVLYNPQAVFFTMPLALLAIGSELDPEIYEVVTIDGARLRVRHLEAIDGTPVLDLKPVI